MLEQVRQEISSQDLLSFRDSAWEKFLDAEKLEKARRRTRETIMQLHGEEPVVRRLREIYGQLNDSGSTGHDDAPRVTGP